MFGDKNKFFTFFIEKITIEKGKRNKKRKKMKHLELIIRILSTVSLFLLLMLSSTNNANASSNICMNAKKGKYSFSCPAYQYDTITVYFKDNASVAQEVQVHRVKSPYTGVLLHAAYDFKVNCHNQLSCSNTTLMAQEVMYAFGRALHNNALYALEPKSCDPSLELCCDAMETCTQVQDSQNATSLTTDDEVQSTQKGGKPTRPHLAEKAIVTSDAAISLIKNLFSKNPNPTQFSAAFVHHTNSGPKFLFALNSNQSYAQVCKMVNDTCTLFEGEIYFGGNSFSASFSHAYGDFENKELHDMIWNFTSKHRYSTCSADSSCTNNQTLCTAIHSCRAK